MATVPVSQINSAKNKKVGGTNQVVDLYLVYQFMKRLTTPFDKWPAYELGIIDDQGKVLKPKRTLMTTDERQAWGYYDIVCANLKKILAKLPGGRSKLVTIAAATFLFKEHKNIQLMQNQKLLEQTFCRHLKTLKEEGMVAANATGAQIAGTEPQNPTVPVRKRKRTITNLIRRKSPVTVK
jgi:hypothetical protein